MTCEAWLLFCYDDARLCAVSENHMSAYESDRAAERGFRQFAVSISTLCEYLALDLQNRKNERSAQPNF